MKRPLEIVEVGAGSYENLTGSGVADINLVKTVPRTIILQSPNQFVDGIYREEIQTWKTYAQFLGVKIIYGDIYACSRHACGLQKEFAPNSVGFWALGNVVNDPFFAEEKNFANLANLFNLTLTGRGVILFTDISPNPQDPRFGANLIYQRLRRELSHYFEVRVDEVQNTSMPTYAKAPLILKLLTPLGIIDQALENSLRRAAPGSWIIYQK